MKLPNVLSTAVVLSVAFLLEYLSGGIDQVVPSVWVPASVLLLTGVAKALQVYAEQQRSEAAGDRGVAVGFVGRVLRD